MPTFPDLADTYHVQLSNCQAFDNGGAGFSIARNNARLSMCQAAENTSHGITASADDVLVESCGCWENGGSGIVLSGADYTVSGSFVTQNTGNGIDAGGSDGAVVGNIARANSVQVYGVNVTGSAIYVMDNDLRSGGTSANLNDAGSGTDTTSANRTA